MYTEGKLREVLQFTYEDSIFYREELGTCELFPGILELQGSEFMDAFGKLPLMSSEDLRARGMGSSLREARGYQQDSHAGHRRDDRQTEAYIFHP